MQRGMVVNIVNTVPLFHLKEREWTYGYYWQLLCNVCLKIMKLLKSKVEKFVAKRVAILLCFLSVLDFLILKQKWLVFAGLLAGCASALLRFGLLAASIFKLSSHSDKKTACAKSVTGYIKNLLILSLLLGASLILNKWFAAGVIAGIFTVPFILFLNSLTEGLGITHNNFE